MPDEIDRANDQAEQMLASALVIHRLRNEAALHRTHAIGEAGDCIDCGDAIPAARLLAAPFAARCIHCQSAFERRR